MLYYANSKGLKISDVNIIAGYFQRHTIHIFFLIYIAMDFNSSMLPVISRNNKKNKQFNN